MIKNLLLLTSGVLGIIGVFLLVTKIKLMRGIARQKREDKAFIPPKLHTDHGVDSLTIIPLVEYYAASDDLQTEAGVSYLIEAGGHKILMDLGANEKKAHPSPLLANAQKLGVDLTDLDALFLSHLHRDHVGGIDEEKRRVFAFSKGPFSCKDLPVYSPETLGEVLPPWAKPTTITAPKEIFPGVWSMGPMGRSLFLMGYTLEHVLAVHVKGKGMALIIGCGHPGIQRIIRRCQALFPHPIFAVIGGLHYPVHGGRMMLGPINLQKLVGVDRMPWNGLNEKDVKRAMTLLKKVGIQRVSLSGHDSSDWALDTFQNEFDKDYKTVLAGKPITA